MFPDPNPKFIQANPGHPLEPLSGPGDVSSNPGTRPGPPIGGRTPSARPLVMSRLPDREQEFLTWAAQHLTIWAGNGVAPTIGMTAEQVAAAQLKLDAA